MSGPASVILCGVALFLPGSPRFFFAVLAYIGLLIFAVSTALKNRALLDRNLELKSEADAKIAQLIKEKKELAETPSMRAKQEFLGTIAMLVSKVQTEWKHKEGLFVGESIEGLSEAVFRLGVVLPHKKAALLELLERFKDLDNGQFDTGANRMKAHFLTNKNAWERVSESLEAFEKEVNSSDPQST